MQLVGTYSVHVEPVAPEHPVWFPACLFRTKKTDGCCRCRQSEKATGMTVDRSREAMASHSVCTPYIPLAGVKVVTGTTCTMARRVNASCSLFH